MNTNNLMNLPPGRWNLILTAIAALLAIKA